MAKRHVATPDIPDAGLEEWQGPLFGAFKENLELLTGTRGESDGHSIAVTRGDVQFNLLGLQLMHTVSTNNVDGFTISASDVAGLDAFRELRNDVQRLANDLFRTRELLDAILKNMKGA